MPAMSPVQHDQQPALTTIRGMLGRFSARTMNTWPGVITLAAPAPVPTVARATAGKRPGGFPGPRQLRPAISTEDDSSGPAGTEPAGTGEAGGQGEGTDPALACHHRLGAGRDRRGGVLLVRSWDEKPVRARARGQFDRRGIGCRRVLRLRDTCGAGVRAPGPASA